VTVIPTPQPAAPLACSVDFFGRRRGGLWLRLFPCVPRPARTVRAAVWLTCAGAVIPAVSLILALVTPTEKRIVGGLVQARHEARMAERARIAAVRY
jgi:hypothetical protein